MAVLLDAARNEVAATAAAMRSPNPFAVAGFVRASLQKRFFPAAAAADVDLRFPELSPSIDGMARGLGGPDLATYVRRRLARAVAAPVAASPALRVAAAPEEAARWWQKRAALASPRLHLPAAARSLLLALWSVENRASGAVWATAATLGVASGQHERSVRRWVARLVSDGILEDRSGGGGRGKVREVRIRWRTLIDMAAEK